jgi:integrase
MARPPLPIGAHGKITVRKITLKDGRVVHEARCRYRRADGSLQRLKRTRKSKAAAENALKEAVTLLTEETRSGDVKPVTRLKVIAERWFTDEVELAVSEGRKSPKTGASYRSYLNKHILPAMGELRMQEVDTVRCEALMAAKRREGARDDKLAGIRNVLSGVCGYAVRHGALKSNPVRELSRLDRVGRPEPRPLTAAERKDLLSKLDKDEKARELELADILRGLLATGVRIGELLGCCGDDVLLDDPKQPRLVVEHRTGRVKGEGTVRRPLGRIKEAARKRPLPAWSVPLFRARKLASGGSGPLFATPFGEWRTPDSVTSQLRVALDRVGYGWVTSHNMRDTVASMMREAGIPVREIADWLGQRSTAVTERHYLEDKVNERNVAALEGMM